MPEQPDDPVPSPLGGRSPDRVAPGARLRSLLARPEALVLPGVVDAAGALLVERAGFDACYLTGAGVANAQLGVADIGLLSMTEMAAQAQRVADATPLPVLVDGDTGHGGPIAVMRTVHAFEAAGAAGIQLEDQEAPKRCGHFDRKQVVPVADMVAKILAARRARRDEDFVIVARTDARAVLDVEATLVRARAYARAGADVLFVEAPESVAELERFARELAGVPLVANVVEGGRTPQVGTAALERMGYKIVLHANLLLRVAAQAGLAALRELHRHRGSEHLQDRMLGWQERQELFGLDRLDAIEDALGDHAESIVDG